MDVSDATVVTLYLLAASNVKLRPILTRARSGLVPASSRTTIRSAIGNPTSWIRSPMRGTSRTLFLWTTMESQTLTTPNPDFQLRSWELELRELRID